MGPRALLSTRYQAAAGAAPNDEPSEGASAGQDGTRTSEVSRSVTGVVAAFVLSTLGAWPAGAEAPVTAGHVAGLGGATSDYEIRRDASGREQRVRVWYYMPVLSRDRIIVEREDGWLDLALGEGRTIRVRSENSPYPVPEVGDPPTPLGNLMAKVVATVGGMLSWSKNQEEAAQAIGLTSRSGEAGRLRLPLLGDGLGRIVAGERKLSLTWRGGVPPYEVRLYGPEASEPLLHVTGLTDPRLPSRRLTLAEGRYRLEIRDGAGESVTAEFEAVAESTAPELPPDAGFAALPKEMRTTVRAAWIAGQDDGLWMLEGYTRAAALADLYEPARILRDALADGQVPRMH